MPYVTNKSQEINKLNKSIFETHILLPLKTLDTDNIAGKKSNLVNFQCFFSVEL